MEYPYKILILHAVRQDSRQTTIDHIYCYPKYCAGALYVYHNINAPVSQEIVAFPFDAIILNYCFLSYRTAGRFEQLKTKYEFLRSSVAFKIAIPQDDYTYNEVLDDWLEEIGVDIIFTPLDKHLYVLYPKCHSRVKFKSALTGYSQKLHARLLNFALPFRDRAIDVGSRVRYLPPHYGRAGVTKGRITEQFRAVAQAAGFNTDISTDIEDSFAGDEWFDFLGSCKFTLIARGGASMCDPRGEVKLRVQAYLKQNPTAAFEEVEAACFPALDRYDFSAVSPRLFEAASLGTGLILIQDDYLPGLEPFKHYIPLERDFSNLHDVFAVMRDENRVEQMRTAAYEFLIEGGQFSYSAFVDDVLGELKAARPVPRQVTEKAVADLVKHFRQLASSQRLCVEAPPHWSEVARYTVYRAQSAAQLEAVRDLIAVKQTNGAIRSTVAADVMTFGLLDPALAGLGIESMSGLNDEGELGDLAQFVDDVRAASWTLDGSLDWGYCEYIFESNGHRGNEQ